MVSSANVVFIDRHIMDVAFLISLTHKNVFISPPPPHSCLLLVLWFVFFWRLIALTFAGNTCLMKVWVCICIGFSEFNKPAMCKISHSHFSPSFCLYCLLEQSTAHIWFWLRFSILWVNWSIKDLKGGSKDFPYFLTLLLWWIDTTTLFHWYPWKWY